MEPIEWVDPETLVLAAASEPEFRPVSVGLVCLSSSHLPAERLTGTSPPAAVYVGQFARPCGHGPGGPGPQWAELCGPCLARDRARPVAGRATVCPVCGVESRVELAAARDINGEAMYR